MIMKILVMGQGGETEQRVVAELLSPEFTVRVWSDDSLIMPTVWQDQVETVAGAPNDVQALAVALAGVESVLWCMPSAPDDEMSALVEWTHKLGAALQVAGVPRLVVVSSAEPITTTALSALRESNISIRHLRCGFAAGSLLPSGTNAIPAGNEVLALPLVVAEDVVNAALRWLVRRDWSGMESSIVICHRNGEKLEVNS
jgi:uncharacterized protein YbjT (DUF2867 family)